MTTSPTRQIQPRPPAFRAATSRKSTRKPGGKEEDGKDRTGSGHKSGTKPGAASVSRQDWIDYAMTILGEHGPDAVRIERLCTGLGITKGSFYWHFKASAALRDAMLEHWQYKETQAIIDEVETPPNAPLTKLELLFNKANAGVVDFRAEMAVRQWALQDEQVARVVEAVDRRRLDFLYRQFAALGFARSETRLRARLLYSLMLGEAMIHEPEPRQTRKTRWRESFALLTGQFEN